MDEAAYVLEMTETMMEWPIPDAAQAVEDLRGHVIRAITENPDLSVVEAIIPGLVVVLGALEARIVALESAQPDGDAQEYDRVQGLC